MKFYCIEQFEFYIKVEMMRLFNYLSKNFDPIQDVKYADIDRNMFNEVIMRELKITILNNDEIDTIVEYLRFRFKFDLDIAEQFRGMLKIKQEECDIVKPSETITYCVKSVKEE